MWKETLHAKLDNSVQAVILLLPGSKGNCVLYDEIKRLLLEEIPIVSQVVLVGTIRAGKNIRSIVSKILIQVCAKIGGVPWTIDDMPLLDRPAMVCGLDVYHATHLGRKSVLGFCSSFNNSATRYWSKSIIQDTGVEVSVNLQSLMERAIKKFEQVTTHKPERIFFYRDGVGED
jgi:aubergine-like protein